jgi:hypothetical protein
LYLFLPPPTNFFAWVLCFVDDWQVFIINFTTTTAILSYFIWTSFSIIVCVCVHVTVWVRVRFHVFHAPTIQQQFNLVKRYLCSDHYVSIIIIIIIINLYIYIYIYIYIWTQPILKRTHTWQLQVYSRVNVTRTKSEFVFTSTTGFLSGKGDWHLLGVWWKSPDCRVGGPRCTHQNSGQPSRTVGQCLNIFSLKPHLLGVVMIVQLMGK